MIKKFIRMMVAFLDAIAGMLDQIATNLEAETARRKALKDACGIKMIIRCGKTYCTDEALEEIEHNLHRVMQLEVAGDIDVITLISGLDALIKHVKNLPSKKDVDDYVISMEDFIKSFAIYTCDELDARALMDTMLTHAKIVFVPGYKPEPARFHSKLAAEEDNGVDDAS